MHKKLRRARRLLAVVLTAGVMFQTVNCAQLGTVAQELVLGQVALVVSDTIAFFLDNLFVRLRN